MIEDVKNERNPIHYRIRVSFFDKCFLALIGIVFLKKYEFNTLLSFE
jgi:hypothetical protein